ncbi:MAG: hypothetical protein V3W28_06230 [Thermoplasmata archaeon]
MSDGEHRQLIRVGVLDHLLYSEAENLGLLPTMMEKAKDIVDRLTDAQVRAVMLARIEQQTYSPRIDKTLNLLEVIEKVRETSEED